MLALLCALRRRGLGIAAAKIGPDYIDTAFHAFLSSAPAANLDLWMSRRCRRGKGQDKIARPLRRLPAALQRLIARMTLSEESTADIVLAEGTMGIFDGAVHGEGCTAHLAALLGWPLLLVLNAKGLGHSIAAVAEGFLQHRPAWLRQGHHLDFAGIVCTHVGSIKHAEIIREAFKPVTEATKVPILGLLPREGAPLIPSRHLGLHQVRETLPELHTDRLADWLEDNFDVPGLLDRLGVHEVPDKASPSIAGSSDKNISSLFFTAKPHRKPRSRIAMARDAAFSFCYADLPAVLQELGAEIYFFSPLEDKAPPPCQGLYFPGGYPELYAERLSSNICMRQALRSMACRGVPIYGECGGYIYLMRHVEVEGRKFPMSGLLPLSCRLGERLAALGYRQARAMAGWPSAIPQNRQPLFLRGHEFHYAVLDDVVLPSNCMPLWDLQDSGGTKLGTEGCRYGSAAGSWLHLYPEGARQFWKYWLASLPSRTICPE